MMELYWLNMAGPAAFVVLCALGWFLYRYERRARFPWAEPLRTGRKIATIATLCVTGLGLINLAVGYATGTGSVLMYLFCSALALSAAAGAVFFALGFSLTGLKQTIRARAQEAKSPETQPLFYRYRLAVFLTPLLILFLVASGESRSRGYKKTIGKEDTTEEQLRAIADSSWRHIDPRMERWLASNKKLPPEILRELASNSSEITRSIVGWNPGTPTDVVHALSRDESELVRRETVRNLNAPVELLDASSRDEAASVRMSVARHKRTSRDLLAHLARDPSSNVRYYVANNPNTPNDILQTLKEDNEEANPFYPDFGGMPNLGPCYRYTVSSAVASNPSTSPEVLKQLFRSEECTVRRSVARNKSTPDEILVILQDDPELPVSMAARISSK